jgi:hypothetical protein
LESFHEPAVAFVSVPPTRPEERVPEDSLAIVLTGDADTEAHLLPEPTRVVGFVRKDAVPTEIAPLLAALADICSRDSV